MSCECEKAERKSESAEMARHYGNMRFAMFTVFSAIVGGLILIPLDKERVDLIMQDPQRLLLGVSGLVLSIGFLLAEWRISDLVVTYQEAAFGPDFAEPDGHKFWKHFVPCLMILPYILSSVFWIMFLTGCIIFQSPGQ